MFIEVNRAPFIRELQNEISYSDFTQDTATVHTANFSKTTLQQTFSQGFIHLRLWPPGSPNFNALNYYLMGKQINRFYVNNLCFAKTENNIQAESANISGPDLHPVKRNVFRRCEDYLGAGGSHNDTVQ